ncbi:hypothetical protein [Bosea sp. UC22_33]
MSLTAVCGPEYVEVKVLDHIVAEFTPEEARDFARAVLTVSSD